MQTKITTTVLFLITVLYFASCGNKTSESQKENTTTEQSDSTKYQCPMDCEHGKTYNKAGKCPVCEMDLEKK